jgi:hypothetical protein
VDETAGTGMLDKRACKAGFHIAPLKKTIEEYGVLTARNNNYNNLYRFAISHII